ncbi:hypothetical protein Taro_016727 [Colocasia esculenta]|uniref:RNase H type-1 domain-containing protein n=1 Tax=Colocasia esculenta TaxID=4460 RepID=A0A843UPB9_COLES|nr:hypothetical protein [Colocasia esculenta]
MFNIAWQNALPETVVRHLPRGVSDHAPLLVDQKMISKFPSRFIFQEVWASHDDFLNVISNAWKEVPSRILAFDTLLCRLRAVKMALRAWNKDVFGRIQESIDAAELESSNAEKDFDLMPIDANRMAMSAAHARLRKAYVNDEKMWCQKARMTWMQNGDRNTSFYQAVVKNNRRRNYIHRLKIEGSDDCNIKKFLTFLKAYENSSGQKVNVSKSSFFISPKASASTVNTDHALRSHALIGRIMEKVNVLEYPDQCVWIGTENGYFSTKSAFNTLRPHGVRWPHLLKIWHYTFNPRASLFACSCCVLPSTEDIDHLFLEGDIALALWNWARPLLCGQVLGPHITSTLWNIISVLNCQNAQGFIATYAVLLLLWEIWKHRCAKRFDSSSKSVGKIIADIRYAIHVALQGVTFKHECAANSLAILQTFGFKPKVKLKAPKIVRWIPPQHGVCLNVDGACKGNPGPCGGGGCMRNSAGDILLGFAFYYGYGDSLLAEVRALADGLRLAELHGKLKLHRGALTFGRLKEEE